MSGGPGEAVGRPQVAESVYRELIQFYPNDPFATLAGLSELPGLFHPKTSGKAAETEEARI